MTEPNFLPGQKADCGRCGTEVTLYPHPEHGVIWKHSAPGQRHTHPIRSIEYDPDDLLSKEKSDEFVGGLVKLAKLRGQGRSKVEIVAPEVEPHAPSDYSVRATGRCKICRNPVTTILHPETNTPVWSHDKGPVHPEPINIAHTTVRAPKLSDDERSLIKPVNVGKPVGNPVTGEVVIPGSSGRHRWDPTKGEVVQVSPGRESETVQADADYIDADGKLTSKREATLSKLSRVDRGVILKGEAHLEKDHPWIAEDDVDPNNQNINKVIHPETGRILQRNLEEAPRGDIFSSVSGEVPARETPWKSSGPRATVDIQIGKRLTDYIDRARWHKETFDKNDQFEYHVYTERPEIGAARIAVRRRLKYCQKCAPVLLQNGSIPHANTDPTLPRIPNPGQSFVRPEPKELPEGTRPWTRTLPSGKISVGRHPNATSTPIIRGLEARVKSFQTGSGEGSS